jgi:hypothetical protein
MMQRCYNTERDSYPKYGGRGIKVCDRWHDFRNFEADMSPRPDNTSLDRIDNEGDYEPSNCRWATRTEQARNRMSNVPLEFEGVTKLECEWCEEKGMKPGAIRKRLRRGWTVEQAISLPQGVRL